MIFCCYGSSSSPTRRQCFLVSDEGRWKRLSMSLSFPTKGSGLWALSVNKGIRVRRRL